MTSKPKGAKNKTLRVFIVIFALGVVVSGYFVYREFSVYKAGNDAYDDLRQFVDSPDTNKSESDSANPGNTDTGDGSDRDIRLQYESYAPDDPAANNKTDALSENDSSNETDTSGDANFSGAPNTWPIVDFDGLKGINSDVAAWLRCPGTAIDYPVVYGEDNEYYLDHLVSGTQNKAGSLFIDCRNAPDFSFRNTIIYGHNMRNGSMFRIITQFGNQSFFNTHPFMYLVMPNGDCFYIELFAAFTSSVNEDAWKVDFYDNEEFESWLEWVNHKSVVKSNVQVNADDRVVTFSTCSYSFNNARFIAVGKLSPYISR